mmetsp:Transcript_53153/g.108412  ORF Transcript_53153/g.108412 Transcript_53153/m.108412 type:complete len:335 (+) Transcript_53153:1497-2501(+)
MSGGRVGDSLRAGLPAGELVGISSLLVSKEIETRSPSRINSHPLLPTDTIGRRTVVVSPKTSHGLSSAFTMMTPTAPALFARFTLDTKLHFPLAIITMFPFTLSVFVSLASAMNGSARTARAVTLVGTPKLARFAGISLAPQITVSRRILRPRPRVSALDLCASVPGNGDLNLTCFFEMLYQNGPKDCPATHIFHPSIRPTMGACVSISSGEQSGKRAWIRCFNSEVFSFGSWAVAFEPGWLSSEYISCKALRFDLTLSISTCISFWASTFMLMLSLCSQIRSFNCSRGASVSEISSATDPLLEPSIVFKLIPAAPFRDDGGASKAAIRDTAFC